jgi:ribose 1,5-bisphosphokinase
MTAETAMRTGRVEGASGALIVVVGPSGAGKDTLIDFVRARFVRDPAVLFVRRVVTRPAEADAEDHDSLPEDDFRRAEAAGAFAFTWRAHGLFYGWPKDVDEHLARGGVVIANGSRATLPRLAERYPQLVVASIVVKAAILAERLKARGREDAAEIEARLARAERYEVPAGRCVPIANDGVVDVAGNALAALVDSALRGAPVNA